ncbi:bucentaur or craniofacial development-domain-containing protein [Plectosphaerella plurivora]|uniref:SWR1-complex protein 5 n=1 Tax=Plectosphaerella plurivora TaxID=936078 RepID=A0A9P9A4J7_9PEZI|nr:bucentaur or craniofacial development-domain-containing protein [Plectosphaerella plurivora]
MRAQEKAEKKVAAVQGPVTIDVDSVWAQMMAGTPTVAEDTAMDVDQPAEPPKEAPEMIRIKRTYNFAGKVHTEEKLVARDSAEARLFLASQDKEAPEEETDKPRRVLRKAFRSAFEPVIDGLGNRTDLDLGVEGAIRAREGRAEAAKKLNTVEKSRMDWAGYVDKEGLKDELELAGRSKGAYNERQGFLARSEAKREEDAWRARQAGRA